MQAPWITLGGCDIRFQVDLLYWCLEGTRLPVVSIIADGQKKIHTRALDCLSMYQPGKGLCFGTHPSSTSIYRLWKAFNLDSNVGGACLWWNYGLQRQKKLGRAPQPIRCIFSFSHYGDFYFPNTLFSVAAQNFEYQVSCVLDKSTESLFGSFRD